VSIPDSAVLDSLSTNATLDAWIKPALPLGAEAWLFARRDPFVSEGFSVALLQDGRMQLTVRTTTSPTVSGSTFRSTASVVTFDQWQHVAAAVDTVAGTAQIWVNGQAVSLTAVFGPATLSGTLVQCEPAVSRPTARPEHGGWGRAFQGPARRSATLRAHPHPGRGAEPGADPSPWRPMSMTRSRAGPASRSRTGSRRPTPMIPPQSAHRRSSHQLTAPQQPDQQGRLRLQRRGQPDQSDGPHEGRRRSATTN
jgi:hypothetical protein